MVFGKADTIHNLQNYSEECAAYGVRIRYPNHLSRTDRPPTNVVAESGGTLYNPCKELECSSTLDRLVSLDSTGGEVLPEMASVPSPLQTVGHKPEVVALPKSGHRCQ